MQFDGYGFLASNIALARSRGSWWRTIIQPHAGGPHSAALVGRRPQITLLHSRLRDSERWQPTHSHASMGILAAIPSGSSPAGDRAWKARTCSRSALTSSGTTIGFAP